MNLEAEACGTPVVTYDTGGCAETVNLADSRAVTNYCKALFVLETGGFSQDA